MALDGWREVLLEDVAEEITVGHVGPMASEYVPRGIPFLRSQNVEPLRISTKDLKFITSSFHERLQKSCLSPGDVVIVRTGKPGACAVIPSSLEIANCSDLVIVRCGPQLDPHFLAYYVNSVAAHHVDAHLVGAVQQHFNVGSARKLLMQLPKVEEQRAIAHVLGTLDDKIELNWRMNETLEAIARAIFTERAREEDWDEYPLGDLCTIYDGPHATPKLVEHGPIFLGISNLANGFLDLSETAHVTDEDFAKWTRRVTPSAGDVVFSYETRLGQAAIIPEGLKCCLGRRIGLLRPTDGRVTGFVLLQAYLAAEFQETIRQRTIHGSTVDRIPLKEMGSFPIRLPAGEARLQLADLLLPMRSRVEHNQRESHTLAALRDTLLPKLISGELRVEDAERFLEECAHEARSPPSSGEGMRLTVA